MDAVRTVQVALNPTEMALVRQVLREHVPCREVWAFGSRITGRAKPFSDLDLALAGDEPLSLSERAALAEAFEDSDLPFRVDLVDLCSVEASFAELIRREGVPIGAARFAPAAM